MTHVYNKGFGKVERLDQNVICYMTNIRSKKWWWSIFRLNLDVPVNNAFQVHKAQDRSTSQFTTLDHLGFWRAIAAVCFSTTSRAEVPKQVSFSLGRPVKYNHTSSLTGKITGFPKEHNAYGLLAMWQRCIFVKNAMYDSIFSAKLKLWCKDELLFASSVDFSSHLSVSRKFPVLFERVLA